MTLELIIQEIKVLGNILTNANNFNEEQENQQQLRKFRVKIGNEQFTSRNHGQFFSSTELVFSEPFSYIYDYQSHMLFIQVFRRHNYLDNSDLEEVLTAEIDLSDITNLNGEYIETTVNKTDGSAVGKLILTIQTFKKGPKYFEKVNSKIFFEAVKQEKEKQIVASAAAKNIKNLLVNNTLTDTLMTINAMTLICEKEEPQIYMRDGFILIRYGLTVKAYSSIVKMTTKQSVNWLDYIEFMKNEGVKFEFFFFHYDELGVLQCKAKGEIKYVVFDETINLHSISMFDKRSNKYGTLMVKFIEKEVDKVSISNKLQKKIREQESVIQQVIEEFNQFKFENKNNGHILSQKLIELQKLEQSKQDQRSKPLNPEEKKKMEEHVKFIQFMQREMIKIERELTKRQQDSKKDQKKHLYLPSVEMKKQGDSRVSSPRKWERNQKMNVSVSSRQFQKVKLPRI